MNITQKKCAVCGKEFSYRTKEKNRKYCSMDCYISTFRNRKYPNRKKPKPFTEEHKKRIGEGHIGLFHSDISKKKMSEVRKGKKLNYPVWNKGIKYLAITNEKHFNWKGENVSYRGLHYWINRKLGKPCECEFCHRNNLKGREIHWANKSGNYLRELTDWIRLCVKCHKFFDKYVNTTS